LPGNVEAVKVWGESRTQVLVGVGGLIDINTLAIKMTMDLYEVRDQKTCMEKVRLMFDEYAAAIREKDANAKPED
jgi:hypothetical protein